MPIIFKNLKNYLMNQKTVFKRSLFNNENTESFTELMHYCHNLAISLQEDLGEICYNRHAIAKQLMGLLEKAGANITCASPSAPTLFKAIAIVWTIDDIQMQRPDLTKAQAAQVLRQLKKYHDAGIGINWEVIDCFCDAEFPPQEAAAT